MDSSLTILKPPISPLHPLHVRYPLHPLHVLHAGRLQVACRPPGNNPLHADLLWWDGPHAGGAGRAGFFLGRRRCALLACRACMPTGLHAGRCGHAG